jgi:hypothetical protein
MSKPSKPYWKMTTEELAETTREFDREHIGESFREMTPAEEKAWRTAMDKPPSRRRTVRNKPVKTVSVDIQVSLVKQLDRQAKKRGISRADLLEEILEATLTNGRG